MFKNWWEFTGTANCVQDVGGNKVATLSCIPAVVANLISALIVFAGLMTLLMFIKGSIKLMKAGGGDPKATSEAVHNFTYGLLGLSIIIFSFLMIQIISAATGVTCLTSFGFGCN
jgi:hypothetical protein